MNTIFIRLPVVAIALLFTAFLYGQRDTLVRVPLPGQEMPVLRAKKNCQNGRLDGDRDAIRHG